MSTDIKTTPPAAAKPTLEEAIKQLISVLDFAVEHVGSIEISLSAGRVRVITKDRSLTSLTIKPIGGDDD